MKTKCDTTQNENKPNCFCLGTLAFKRIYFHPYIRWNALRQRNIRDKLTGDMKKARCVASHNKFATYPLRNQSSEIDPKVLD